MMVGKRNQKGIGVPMKETILLYHFTDQERLAKLKKALLPMGVRLRVVKKEDYLQPVGYLAGDKEVEPVEAVYDGVEFEREMMLMAGFSSSRVDAVLMALRKHGVGRVDYKAVLTPTNRYWDSVKLFGEIGREHAYMSGEQKETEGKPENGLEI